MTNLHVSHELWPGEISFPGHAQDVETARDCLQCGQCEAAHCNDRRFDMVRVRSYVPADRAFVLSLAPRLTIGMQPWRDLELWLATVEGWVMESIRQDNQKTTVLIAEDEGGKRLGFATVSHDEHFTGQSQANIGELVTRETFEGCGVGSALVEACERWAREQGYALITVSTGAANARALGFYHHLDFYDEDVTLTKLL
jgi:GNAT superfamily N-acetyltransferase